MIRLYKYILHLGIREGLGGKQRKKIRLLNQICFSEVWMCLGLVLAGLLFDRWRWMVAGVVFLVFAVATILIQAQQKYRLARRFWVVTTYLTLFSLIVMFGRGSGAEHVLMILPVLGALFANKRIHVQLFFVLGVFSLSFCFVYYAMYPSLFVVEHTVWDQLVSTISVLVIIFLAFIFFRNQLAASEALVLKQTNTLFAEMAAKNRQQQLILEKESYLSTILAHTPIMLIIMGPQGQVKFCEGKIIEKLTLDSDGDLQARIQEMRKTHPDFDENIQRVLSGEKREFQYASEKDTYKFSFNPVFNEAGEMEYTIGVCMDISDLKSVEQALAGSETLHREVIESAFDGIFVFNVRTLKPESCNRRVLEMFNCTEEEFLTVGPIQVMPEYQPNGDNSYQRLTEYIQQVYQEGRVRFEWVNTRLDGKRFLTECALATLPRPYKHLIVTVIKDITHQKEAEFKRLETLKRLKEVNGELEQFAYVVSHDLKAPLRSISSLSGWIIEDYRDKLDDKGRQMMELLIGRTERLHNLIEGVLAYSRVGRESEQKSLVGMEQVLEQIIDSLSPPDHISIQIETEMPELYVEQTRLGQLFQNLLSNAIKFMDKEKGLIQLGCLDEGNQWHFYVRDNGPGIEETYYNKIFEIFQTLEARDKVESTGVGLTIVKKVVELYGGKIKLDSKIGHGSTFHIFLPKINLLATNDKAQLRL